jgi:hypothetical protein
VLHRLHEKLEGERIGQEYNLILGLIRIEVLYSFSGYDSAQVQRMRTPFAFYTTLWL